MTELTGIRWVLFGVQLSIVGSALLIVSEGNFLALIGMGMLIFGLLCGVIGQISPVRRDAGSGR